MKRLELITDLGQIRRNALEIRARVSEKAKLLCVVKADAYGHGSLQTAKTLEDIADAYAVATPDEGALLRLNDVSKPIVVLGAAGGPDEMTVSVRFELSQAVTGPEDALMADQAAKELNKTAKVHIKADTGMSRIGIRENGELIKTLETLKNCAHVQVSGLFTHFCAADTDPEFTLKQKNRFDEMRMLVLDAGFTPVCHAAASTAMLKPGYEYDIVRAGIALYGTGVEELSGVVHPAQSLISRPAAFRTVSAGETVGYGRRFTALKDSVIMTVPCGYGDGYPRILGGRADLLVNGRRAPVVGSVCMDMLMADVTGIDGLSRDSRVTLMGRDGDEVITPDELALKAETIPYEIMLGFSNRPFRSWINE